MHLPLLQGIDGVTITALADLDGDALAVANELAPAARRFASLAAMLDAGSLDAVVISTPPADHAAAACAAFSDTQFGDRPWPASARRFQLTGAGERELARLRGYDDDDYSEDDDELSDS